MKIRLELKIVLKGEKLEVDRKERRLLQFGSPSLHTDVSPEETRGNETFTSSYYGSFNCELFIFSGVVFFVCVFTVHRSDDEESGSKSYRDQLGLWILTFGLWPSP